MTTSRPGLWRHRGYLSLLATQFLGAFNDNLFKQLVLLTCVDIAQREQGGDYQGLATQIFTLPFVLLSGVSGMLADRWSKSTIIRGCKWAEIAIVMLGMLAFTTHQLLPLFAVLGLMGIHSAVFGPPKYGILPELVHESDLPQANGLILMTTFLAVILGFATAGYVKSLFGDQLWLASGASLIVAVLGTLTSHFIPSLPAAAPELKLAWSGVLIDPPTRRVLWQDRRLLGVLLAYSVFWMAAGLVFPPTINDVGKRQMELGDARTSLLGAGTSLGIGAGCILAAALCRDRVAGWLVTAAGWGLCATLCVLGLPGPRLGGTFVGAEGLAVGLVLIGVFAGTFSVPLQVYLQSQSPKTAKGRIIGAMNLLNFLGIFLAGVVYSLGALVLEQLLAPPSGMFFVAAAIVLVMMLVYRPPTIALAGAPTTDDLPATGV